MKPTKLSYKVQRELPQKNKQLFLIRLLPQEENFKKNLVYDLPKKSPNSENWQNFFGSLPLASGNLGSLFHTFIVFVTIFFLTQRTGRNCISKIAENGSVYFRI